MKTIFAAALVAAAGLSAPATAQSATARLVVNAEGLDLATAQGRRSLDLRIVHAVSSLCGTPSPADGRARAKLAACRTEATASAASARDHAIAAARAAQAVRVAASR